MSNLTFCEEINYSKFQHCNIEIRLVYMWMFYQSFKMLEDELLLYTVMSV